MRIHAPINPSHFSNAGLRALLWLCVTLLAGSLTTSRVQAQAVRAATGETAATLVEKIGAAHKQAIDNAQALATYVQDNETNLDNSVMRAHCDAIGRALDDALYFVPELERMQRTEADKRLLNMVAKHDAAAKATYTLLLTRLRGSSITVVEIKALAIGVHQEVRAAQAQLAQLRPPAAVVARR